MSTLTAPLRSRPTLVVLALLVTAALSACGDDDSAADTTPAPPDTTVPDTTVADVATTAGTATTPAPPTTTPASASSAPATTAATATTGDGDGGASTDREAWVSAGAAAFGGTDTARCMTDAFIDTVGFDELVATGATPEEFFAGSPDEFGIQVAEDDVAALTGDVAACGDLLQILVDSGAVETGALECARQYLDNEIVANVFVSQLAQVSPSAEATESANQLNANC